MDWIFAILLFLHVGGAVVAFGPTFAFPLIGAAAGREPQHVNFALRVQETISKRLVVPLAILQGVTGVLLVWRIGFEILTRGWLLLAIALYVAALLISFLVLLPTVNKLIEATSGPPPAPPAGSPAQAGPPPHIAAMVSRARMGGMLNMILVLAIVFLMVSKPF